MKAIFMGTPDLAAEVLKSLIGSKHEIVLVVTQPDRPKGRGKEFAASPVKEVAVQNQIPVFQPERVKTPEATEVLRSCEADVILVAAFGQILPKEILCMKKYGCINVHASLLPDYRGCAPIQWCVIDGKEKSGVTIMQMDEGIDTGDIICKREITLDANETGGSLFDKLAQMGGPLLLEALEQIESNRAVFTPQTEPTTPYAKMLKKENGKLDFEKSAVVLERLIRGLNPWPSAYTVWNGKTLKLWAAQTLPDRGANAVPGTILSADKDCMEIQTGDGILAVTEVQLEGKRRMSVAEFLRGNAVNEGELLGER